MSSTFLLFLHSISKLYDLLKLPKIGQTQKDTRSAFCTKLARTG